MNTKEALMKALILIDIQHDFLPGGALAVPGGADIIPVVNQLQPRFELVVASQDWHPPDHKSFASAHPGKKTYDVIELRGLRQVLWPDHCVQETNGAAFPAALSTARIEAIFRKGTDPEIDSYSAFYDNGHRKSVGLAGYLREKGVTEVYLAGLAAEICVYYTAMDSLQENFITYYIEDAVRPLVQQEFKKALEQFAAASGHVIHSSNL